MSDDRLDHANIDPEGDWIGALLRPHLAVVDQILPVEVADPLLAEVALQCDERCSLTSTG